MGGSIPSLPMHPLRKDKIKMENKNQNIDLNICNNYIIAPQGLEKDLNDFKKHLNRKTGFSNLDSEIICVSPGLYALGAGSSIGKTTLYFQIGCNMAAAGEYVLFLSYEQSRIELVTKGLSRETALATIKHTPAFDKAVSATDILRGADTAEINDAKESFAKKIGDRLYIIDCDARMSAEGIVSFITTWMSKHNGVTPVVIIDYLQIIPQDPQSQSMLSERAAVNHNLAVLKSFQKKYNLAMFLICSLNRDSYYSAVGMDSFKESGNIEYTADHLWGLQPAVMTTENFETAQKEARRKLVKESKDKTPRKVDLVGLKCRNGKGSFECGFKYYPALNLFLPDTEFCPIYETEYNPFNDDEKQLSFDI